MIKVIAELNHVIEPYMLQRVAYHNSDTMGLIVTGVPMSYHQTNVTLTWKKLAAQAGYYISIMLYLFYGALFYSFLTSISSFIKFSCEFQLRVGLWFNVNAYT